MFPLKGLTELQFPGESLSLTVETRRRHDQDDAACHVFRRLIHDHNDSSLLPALCSGFICTPVDCKAEYSAEMQD